MRTSLSLLTTITCVARSLQWAGASSSAPPLSSSLKVNSDIDGSDKPRHYRKKRRRHGQDGHAAEPHSPLSNALTLETAVKRIKRRRSKKRAKLDVTDSNVSTRADEILLPIPNDDEIPTDEHIAIDVQPDATEGSLERDREQSSPVITETLDFLPSLPSEFSDFEGQEMVNTTIQSEDSSETIEVSEGPNPTITTIQQRKFEKTKLAESNDGQTITFTHEKRKQSVQITTKSHSGNLKSDQIAKRVSTGKGGECLRRIKREWKDAVLMGIAYDWTRMKTIKRKETNSQNNYVRLGPFGKNLLRWHFSVMGPANSVFQDGIYHGRVLLPKEYPGSPPRVQMLTPSGRFVCREDICLSASNYHPETWTPRWTVISLVDALRLHMLTTANEIGGVASSDENRKSYAQSSRSWFLPGVADHRQMLMDGIFTTSENITDVVEESNEMEVNESYTTPHTEDEPHGKRAMLSAKCSGRNPKRSGTSSAKLDTQAATPIIKRNKPKSQKKKATALAKKSASSKDVSHTVNNDKVERTIAKQLVIEILKLPLRILSILLMILTILESKLRSALDGL